MREDEPGAELREEGCQGGVGQTAGDSNVEWERREEKSWTPGWLKEEKE